MGTVDVSIRILRAEGDRQPAGRAQRRRPVSIRALRTESDDGRPVFSIAGACFNPRPPYGERRVELRNISSRACFNPRPPYGERPVHGHVRAVRDHVSIRALRTESDHSPAFSWCASSSFNPRPPYGERPPRHREPCDADFGSIRALRTESDGLRAISTRDMVGFNPRPPYGERQPALSSAGKSSWFQSAPSVRRATYVARQQDAAVIVSIRALRTESD